MLRISCIIIIIVVVSWNYLYLMEVYKAELRPHTFHYPQFDHRYSNRLTSVAEAQIYSSCCCQLGVSELLPVIVGMLHGIKLTSRLN